MLRGNQRRVLVVVASPSWVKKGAEKKGGQQAYFHTIINFGLGAISWYVCCSVLLHGDGYEVMSRGVGPPGAIASGKLYWQGGLPHSEVYLVFLCRS